MTYKELYEAATKKLDKSEITLGEYEEMTKPLDEEVRKKGHWIETDAWTETVDGFEEWGHFRKCSECEHEFKYLESDNFCPNCGADMRGDKE